MKPISALFSKRCKNILEVEFAKLGSLDTKTKNDCIAKIHNQLFDSIKRFEEEVEKQRSHKIKEQLKGNYKDDKLVNSFIDSLSDIVIKVK